MWGTTCFLARRLRKDGWRRLDTFDFDLWILALDQLIHVGEAIFRYIDHDENLALLDLLLERRKARAVIPGAVAAHQGIASPKATRSALRCHDHDGDCHAAGQRDDAVSLVLLVRAGQQMSRADIDQRACRDRK